MAREYFSLSPILSRGAIMNIISSARGPGKSFACKQRALGKWFANREQFMYVRRTTEELKATSTTHFNDILEILYPEYEMRAKGNEFHIRKAKPIGMDSKEERAWLKENPWEVCGYGVAVPQAQTIKSSAFPRVTTIYYDEFIPDNPRALQNPSEVELFLGLIETVARDRKNVKIFMLSNVGMVDNPYFSFYGIESKDFLNQEFVTRNSGAVCMQFYRYSEEQEELASKKISSRIGGVKFTEESVKGRFKGLDAELVRERPEKAEPWACFSTSVETFRVFQSVEGFWVDRGKSIYGTPVFTTSRWTIAEGAFYNRKAIEQIVSIIDARIISFNSSDTKIRFISAIRGA